MVTPAFIGGKDTSVLIDGVSLMSTSDIDKIGILELEDIIKLNNLYLRLKYKVKKHI